MRIGTQIVNAAYGESKVNAAIKTSAMKLETSQAVGLLLTALRISDGNYSAGVISINCVL